MVTYTNKSTKTLESISGKITHAEHTIPTRYYLLIRLSIILYRFKQHSTSKIEQGYRYYLKLWIRFMTLVDTQGGSLNNILFNKPMVEI